MIEIKNDTLRFSFPEIHKHCRVDIEFQRTLRIPDDGSDYPLPPGLGRFPLEHVDDHSGRVSPEWRKRGGVMLPMFASEAMWLSFDGPIVPGHGVPWPFAVKVAAGKINAVDGERWSDDLKKKQDYLVLPEQPWLDGFFASEGLIRQFVAVTMGGGYTVEEQVTGEAEHGGLQLIAYPMKKKEFMRRFPKIPARSRSMEMAPGCPMPSDMDLMTCCEPAAMGMGAGGKMRQEIYDDPYGHDVWEHGTRSRCFVHLCNAMVWRASTGNEPPTVPPTAREYADAGLPWFEWYGAAGSVRKGESWLDAVKSIATLAKDKGEHVLPENVSVATGEVIALTPGPGPDQVREGDF